jgi:hypothetical protein
MLVAVVVRFLRHLRTAADRFGKGTIRILNVQSDVPHSVAMLANVIGGGMARVHGSGEDKIDTVLVEDVRSGIAAASLKSLVGGLRKSKCIVVEVRSLPRIPHPKLDVVNPLDAQRIFGHAFFPPHYSVCWTTRLSASCIAS